MQKTEYRLQDFSQFSSLWKKWLLSFLIPVITWWKSNPFYMLYTVLVQFLVLYRFKLQREGVTTWSQMGEWVARRFKSQPPCRPIVRTIFRSRYSWSCMQGEIMCTWSDWSRICVDIRDKTINSHWDIKQRARLCTYWHHLNSSWLSMISRKLVISTMQYWSTFYTIINVPVLNLHQAYST